MKGTSAHVALELTHVEPVDQWSGKGKADGVWHFWERAGQRHAALKRVAQPPECRLLFTVHMQHVVSVRLEVRWLWPTITKDMVEAAFLHYGTIVHVVIESPTWGAEDRRATRSASASACATSSRTSPSYSDKASAVAAQREMQVFIFIGAPGARDTLSFASTSAWLDDDDDDDDSPEDYTARSSKRLRDI